MLPLVCFIVRPVLRFNKAKNFASFAKNITLKLRNGNYVLKKILKRKNSPYNIHDLTRKTCIRCNSTIFHEELFFLLAFQCYGINVQIRFCEYVTFSFIYLFNIKWIKRKKLRKIIFLIWYVISKQCQTLDLYICRHRINAPK